MEEQTINGNKILSDALKKLEINLLDLVAETSIWALPEVCDRLRTELGSSTRYPKVRRGRNYEEKGSEIDGIRIDDNTYANSAIKQAVGVRKKEISNFHTCHIYPQTCYDERYHTKTENLVLIPNAIAQLSDYFDDVKKALQYRSYELYNWYPKEESKPVKPDNYPNNWRQIIKTKVYLSKKEILEQDMETNVEADKSYYLEREEIEIEKIYSRIPRWIEKEKTQINSIILLTFLELLDGKDFVSKEELKAKCVMIKDFNGNFNQMTQFGVKNHGKVFETTRDEVRLWKPVASFVVNTYKNSQLKEV